MRTQFLEGRTVRAVAKRQSAAIGLCAAVAMFLVARPACSDGALGDAAADARIRVVPYAADEVYRLRGYVGFQIDLEFEPGETFVGLGAGDIESLTFSAQNNHLFLKPRSDTVDTNLTVLTTRRTYHFDYSVSEHRPDAAFGNVIYVLRFAYPPAAQRAASASMCRSSGPMPSSAESVPPSTW